MKRMKITVTQKQPSLSKESVEFMTRMLEGERVDHDLGEGLRIVENEKIPEDEVWICGPKGITKLVITDE